MTKCAWCGGQVLPSWDGVQECLQCSREPVPARLLSEHERKAAERGPRMPKAVSA